MNKKDIEKEDKKPVKLFTLDTETRGLFGEIFRVGLYDGTRHHAANSFEQLKNILINYTTKYECHVFIHNLDFDIAKLAKDVVPGADFDGSIFINNNVTVFKTNLLQQIYATNTAGQRTEETDLKEYPIVFHDSMKLISGSLKRICKAFNIDADKAKIELKDHIIKLGWARDADGNPTDDPKKYDAFESEGYYFCNVDPYEKELNDYLRNDNISLYEIIKILIELSGLPIEDFLRCPTTASLAMKVFEYNYSGDYETATWGYKFPKARTEWDRLKEQFSRDGYYGGRTEVFTPYLKGGYHYDVTSLYPYVMKEHEFPVGFSKLYSGDKARNIFKYWYNSHAGAGFLDCDIYVPETLHIPPLPKKYMGKLCFPVGRLRGVWTFNEIELALEMGCKIEAIRQALYFEHTAPVFKEFVTHFEQIKNNSEGAKREFAKLMQNSLYGKFGMQRARKTLLPASMIPECEEKGYAYHEYINPLYPGEFIEAEVESTAKYIQPHIAAHVTSLARIVLYRGLIGQLKKGAVAYCDTDSIACEKEMEPEMVDSNTYGKWKLEGTIEEALFLQPKVYYEKYADGEEVIRFKGIPRKHLEKLKRGVFFEILDRYKEIQERLERGETVKKKEAYFPLFEGDKKRIKFATTLKNGETNFDLDQEIKKGILLTNKQKREMDYINNTSKPLKVRDY